MEYTGIIFVLVAVAITVFIVFTLIRVVGGLLQKVGPNEALIIYGARGLKVVTGGAAFVIPLYQRSKVFSLELMSFDIAQSLFTTQGIAVDVKANTQIKVRGDEQSIKTATEQYLSRSLQERQSLIGQVMEGHLRGIVGQLTVEDLVMDPERVSNRMLQNVAHDMENMGLQIISFTIREVRDKNGYIDNMGRPRIVDIRKQADIAEANAFREAAIARARADQERVKVEAEAQALQAESQRNLAVKKAAFDAEVKRQQAAADRAYDIQANITQQQVVAEAVRVTEVERLAQIKVQQAEVQRRELELQATTLKGAEAERQRLVLESQGQALATKTRGVAEAEVVRARGQAEAEAIRAKGEAEAEAMKLKAAAYHEYNQAAVLDRLLTSMPEMVRAMAEPLSKVDKVTIVSTGTSDSGSNANGIGANRLTSEMVNMAAHVPALFELLSGMSIGDLMDRVPALATKDNTSANGAKANSDAEQELQQ
jgi:flotillin